MALKNTSGKIFEDTIVETGSNENGKYVKFSNGLMICHHVFTTTSQNTTYHYSNGIWTYPAVFLETPNVQATPNNWNTYAALTKVYPEASKCNVMLHFLSMTGGISAYDSTGNVNLLAVGKWK